MTEEVLREQLPSWNTCVVQVLVETPEKLHIWAQNGGAGLMGTWLMSGPVHFPSPSQASPTSLMYRQVHEFTIQESPRSWILL